MDRQIVYPGAIPLETDILNTNRYAMIGLGRLAMDLIGTATVVSGLACTPTTVASMSVNIGAGAIYSLQNIDNTAYSSLAADTTDQIVKQGILLASAAASLTMAAPTTTGYSIIYLIEAAFTEIDGGSIILPYYNTSNPSVPYSGPSGSGAAQYTVRPCGVNVQAKPGVAATTGTQTAPAVDSGFVPLYYVTIANGQTTITSPNIIVATGAPFLAAPGGFMPIAGGTFTGPVAGPTPGAGDSTTKLATTAFVNPGASLIANGYVRHPSGLIQQWGSVTITPGSNITTTSVSFPIAFPTACLSVVANQTTSADGATWHPLILGALSQGTAGYTLQADTANNSINIASGVTANWIALGH